MIERRYFIKSERFLLCVWGIFCIGFVIARTLGASKIPVNAGLGFDGLEYAHMIKIFPHYWHAFSDYRANRIFPSAIVAFCLQILKLPFSDTNIILGFQYLNLCSLLIAVFCWGKFVKKFRINIQWSLLSFTALFMNRAMIVYSFTPVLTDVMAFCLGIVLFYNYLIKRPLGVFISGLFGAFTFPMFIIIVTLFLLFPARSQLTYESKSYESFYSTKSPLLYNRALTYLVFIFVVMSFLYLISLILPKTLVWEQWLRYYFSKDFSIYLFNRIKNYELLIPTLTYLVEGKRYFFFMLSVFALFVYLYKGLQPFVRKIDFSRGLFLLKFKDSVSFSSLILIGFFFIIYIPSHRCLINSELIGSLTPLSFLRMLILEFFSLPLINIVAAFVYYGPFILLLIFYWRDIVDEAARWSLGCMGVLSIVLLLAITSESRIYINFWGFLVFLATLAVKKNNKDKMSLYVCLFFIFLALFMSKFWMSIYIPEHAPETSLSFLKPVWQGYFMNFGPWMSLKNYLWVCLTLLPCISVGYWNLEKNLKKECNI